VGRFYDIISQVKKREVIKMTGIYKITNLINGKSYIGQSLHIERRFLQHKSPYERERYSNKPLYKAFEKYGIENFDFSIIEECSAD
jgi:group I intron endonuclease